MFIVGTPPALLKVDVEMGGGLPLFYSFNVQLHLLCVWVGVCVGGGGVGWGGGGSKFPLLHFGSLVF